MRIVFFGTGKFAVPVLKRLLASDHEIAAVVTQPDKKKGRGWNVQPTPVKAVVEQMRPEVHVFQPEKASEASFIDEMRGMGADFFVVVDYGKKLPKVLLDLPGKYCINLHPSLLPKYRGAAPVNWAVLNGDKETGNTVIKMSEEMDAGDIIAQEKVEIGEDETAVSLLERLSRDGADLVMKVIDMAEAGEESFTAQDEKGASYAPRLTKEQGRIDWTISAAEITRKVKAMQPWPGAFTSLGGRTLKIIEACTESGTSDAPPGAVTDVKAFIVSTGEGSVRIKMLQIEGKKIMPVREFLKGHRIEKGTVLGAQ